MSKFNPDDKDHLYKVFQPDEHEFRIMYSVGKKVDHAWKKDRNQKSEQVPEWSVYSVYIKRDAIINRLNERFFGEWSSGFIDNQNPCIYHSSHVDCSMHMTIRDVRMEYNGSMLGTGENGAKGAATDAFKRVSSQWGIGLYLQQAPTIMTKNPDTMNKEGQKQAEKEASQKVQKWVNSLLSGVTQDESMPSGGKFTPKNAGGFSAYWRKQGLSNEQITNYLDVKKFSDFEGTIDDANNILSQKVGN